MDSRSFSEYKRKCPNKGENKGIKVYQEGFLSQLDSFSIVHVLLEQLSQLHYKYDFKILFQERNIFPYKSFDQNVFDDNFLDENCSQGNDFATIKMFLLIFFEEIVEI